jgi:hypothetical protein
MRAKQLITVAVATMLLIGGAAALGAASPNAAANDNATDAYDENASEDADAAEADAEDADAANASEARDGNADGVGPSDGLPEQVPDHVSQIHETIESFLSGEVDNLGESLSDLLSNEESADDESADEEAADDGDADDSDAPDETPDSEA